MLRSFSAFLLIGLLFVGFISGPSARAQAPELVSATHTEILDAVAANEARVTVVNFWATWCVPCIEEFPYFMKLDRTMEDQGVDVMFVSTDFPDEREAAREFLAEQGVEGTSYLKEGKTTPFVSAFHDDWTGAIPATFIYDADGELVDFWEGKANYEQLKARVESALSQTTSP